jgi:hypothetical protein
MNVLVEDEYPYLQSLWHVQLLVLVVCILVVVVVVVVSKIEEGGRAVLYAPSYDAESHVYETFENFRA